MVKLIYSIGGGQVWLESCPASTWMDGPGQVMSCLRAPDPLSLKSGDCSYLPGSQGEFSVQIIEDADVAVVSLLLLLLLLLWSLLLRIMTADQGGCVFNWVCGTVSIISKQWWRSLVKALLRFP